MVLGHCNDQKVGGYKPRAERKDYCTRLAERKSGLKYDPYGFQLLRDLKIPRDVEITKLD